MNGLPAVTLGTDEGATVIFVCRVDEHVLIQRLSIRDNDRAGASDARLGL